MPQETSSKISPWIYVGVVFLGLIDIKENAGKTLYTTLILHSDLHPEFVN